MSKKAKGVLFIIIGILIALYFFTLGWVVIGCVGLGFIWGGVEFIRAKDFGIVEEGLVKEEQDALPYLQVTVQNLSKKSGDIFITANIYYQNQIITTVTSNTLTVLPNEIGTLKAFIQLPHSSMKCEELTYKIVNSTIK